MGHWEGVSGEGKARGGEKEDDKCLCVQRKCKKKPTSMFSDSLCFHQDLAMLWSTQVFPGLCRVKVSKEVSPLGSNIKLTAESCSLKEVA